MYVQGLFIKFKIILLSLSFSRVTYRSSKFVVNPLIKEDYKEIKKGRTETNYKSTTNATIKKTFENIEMVSFP